MNPKLTRKMTRKMHRKFFRRLILLLCLTALTGCTGSGSHSLISTNVPPIGSIAATSGTPQSHGIGSAFGQPLVATVTTNGNPAGGIVVTFTAPATGASGTFGDTTSTTANAMADSNGVATSPALVANGIVGTYTVTATISGVLTPATFTLTNTTGAPATIIATSGSGQSATTNAAFIAPLAATVLDIGNNPVSGAVVTFTAPTPASGGPPVASGTFANGTVTETDTTNANGVATSSAFTANGISGADPVTATVAGVTAAATFNLTNAAGAPASIAASSGSPQFTAISTPFSSPLVALVEDASSNPVSGVAVTFTAPTTGASGTFANGKATETDTTNASGLATSSTFTANATTGSYTVTATFPGASGPASFSLTNQVLSTTYVFYLSGQDTLNFPNPNFYALAGAVQVDPTGNVLAGEQDYNDAQGITSPELTGDTITGGTLTVDPTTGQGTLTLITNNTSLGVSGTETLGVQFVNTNHALVMEFDGKATSSGSMDKQTLSALNGGYAFTLYGVDPFYSPVDYGGVFSITAGTTLQNGFVDTNDGGAITQDSPLSGTLSASDSFGRGSLTTTIVYASVGSAVNFNYYIVGPEAIRIIDVDASDSAVGSAFGQGANATSFTNASLGSSVFAAGSNLFSLNYDFAGMLSTSSSAGTFSGVADDSELTNEVLAPAAPISGTYSIASNGYGSLTITPGDLGDVSLLGLYMTDPNLNLADPNNTTSGLGGALIADMDSVLPGGAGVMIPQTDTSTSSFANNYAFAAQDLNGFCCEFDFVGQGSVTAGALTGTGLLGDPFQTLSFTTPSIYTGVTFSGTPLPDSSNVGRYTMFTANSIPNPLVITLPTSPASAFDFNVVLYQASGGLLFWLDEDQNNGSVFLGSLQQQGSLTGIPAVKKAMAKGRSPRK